MLDTKFSYNLILSILFSCFLYQCSDSSKPATSKSEYIQLLDEIPQHIQKVENTTIFSGDSEPKYLMELLPEQTCGRTSEPFLSTIFGSVVDDRGRLIISSSTTNYRTFIYAYNQDGTFHTQIGDQGKGPGEYGHVVGVHAKNGKIYVLDYSSQRLNEYSSRDYSFERSSPFEQWNSDEELEFVFVEARNDENYLVQFSDYNSVTGRQKTKYLVMDKDGYRVGIDSLVFASGFTTNVRKLMRPTMPLTFLGKTITALSGEDVLHTVWTPDFLIKKYDSNHVYRSAIYYPIQGPPFDLYSYTETEMFSPGARDIEKAFAAMDENLPDRFPVVEKLMVDDENRIWVAIPAGVKREDYEWWVLKESGELLAKLTLSKDQPIYDIKNGYLYSKKVNEETESEYVIKYRIELTEK